MRQASTEAESPFLTVVTVVATLALLLGAAACLNNPSGNDGKPESIRLGTLPLETSTLILVAENQHLFARNGLTVDVKYYDTGLGTINALLQGEVDIAGPAAEYVLVGRVFDGERLMAIGSIDKADYQSLIGRKDRGIQSIPDLKGKRIGVIRGTIQEFYVARFLELHGIGAGDATLVNIGLSQLVDAIADGVVDAVVAVPPYSDTIMGKLDKGVVVWPVQSSQLTQQLAICREEWIYQHPKLVERFLRALAEAEEHITKQPGQTKAFLQTKLNLSDADVARVWTQNQFHLSLDQALIAAMEDEARWMIRNNLTPARQVPNFLDYVHEAALKAVKPDAVNLIR